MRERLWCQWGTQAQCRYRRCSALAWAAEWVEKRRGSPGSIGRLQLWQWLGLARAGAHCTVQAWVRAPMLRLGRPNPSCGGMAWAAGPGCDASPMRTPRSPYRDSLAYRSGGRVCNMEAGREMLSWSPKILVKVLCWASCPPRKWHMVGSGCVSSGHRHVVRSGASRCEGCWIGVCGLGGRLRRCRIRPVEWRRAGVGGYRREDGRRRKRAR